jgi:hypothetical protein
MSGLITPRLGALARRTRSARVTRDARPDACHADAAPLGFVPAGRPSAATRPGAACELCGEPMGARHGHLVDLREQALRCVCRACALLFDSNAAGGTHYRLVPDRVRLLDDFRLSELDWVALRIPVDLAFLFESSVAGRTVALYPGPMGATESLLGLDHWKRLVTANPALADLQPDVEALLVDRTRGRREGWLVPIDLCYELVGVIRLRWKGLSGGSEVWAEIDGFFEELRRMARWDAGTRSGSVGGGGRVRSPNAESSRMRASDAKSSGARRPKGG